MQSKLTSLETLAPIALFVYNRPTHTRRTLQALAKNRFAAESTLYIFADGPKADAADADLDRISSTRAIVREVGWCKKVIIREAAINAGLARSIIDGVSAVIAEHGRAIVLEDDIITSPDFLFFMNTALEYYRHDRKLAGVSGFSYPSAVKATKVYFLPIGCSWGWATWKREWDEVNFNAEELAERIQSLYMQKKFDFGGYPFFDMLLQQQQRRIDSWAIRFYASFFLKNRLFVYPPKSLVQNIGFDETATHTTGSELFFEQIGTNKFDGTFRPPVLDRMTWGVKRSFLERYDIPVKTRPMQLFRRYLSKVKQKFKTSEWKVW